MKAARGSRRQQGLPQTVLVLQYTMPLGCCVHGTPLLAARPDATIIVATHDNGLAALLHNPHIDVLIKTPALTFRWKVFAIAGFLRKRLRQRIDRVRTLAGGCGTSLAGRTSIPELAAVLCLCDLLVTLDTGIMHIVRSTDLPMVVLGTAWQEPIEWMPLHKKNVRIIRGEEYEDLPVG